MRREAILFKLKELNDNEEINYLLDNLKTTELNLVYRYLNDTNKNLDETITYLSDHDAIDFIPRLVTNKNNPNDIFIQIGYKQYVHLLDNIKFSCNENIDGTSLKSLSLFATDFTKFELSQNILLNQLVVLSSICQACWSNNTVYNLIMEENKTLSKFICHLFPYMRNTYFGFLLELIKEQGSLNPNYTLLKNGKLFNNDIIIAIDKNKAELFLSINGKIYSIHLAHLVFDTSCIIDNEVYLYSLIILILYLKGYNNIPINGLKKFLT